MKERDENDGEDGNTKDIERHRDQQCRRWYRKTERPVGEVEVEEGNLDDLGKAESADGKVVSAQAQDRKTDKGADPCRDQSADRQVDFEREAETDGADGADKGTDTHEGSMAEGELTSQAGNHIKSQGERYGNPDVDDNLHGIGINEPDDALKQFRHRHQTFLWIFRPSSPVGLKRRTRTRMAKAMASRYDE